jgi:phytoene desaturase
VLGEDIQDYFTLTRLSPSYRVFLKSKNRHYDFFSDRKKNGELFESIEPGSAQKLFDYLDESARQYQIAKKEFMYKNYDSIFDFFNKRVMQEGRKLEIFNTMKKIIGRTFKSELLQKVMQFQMVLLGTAPKDAPGIYRLMNHVDFDLGVWYPNKGIYELPRAIASIAEKNGTTIHLNSPIKKIIVKDKKVLGVTLESGEDVFADIVVSNADMHYTEQTLLGEELSDRKESYWAKKKMAPSALIMYLGTGKQFDSLSHHNLLFSEDWDLNFKQIFDTDMFPEDPSIYVCAPSKTDKTVAPEGKENLFVLVPIASGLTYDTETLEKWTDNVISILEKNMGMTGLRESIEYKKIYCVKDFERDYHSYKGSALGLAHTLTQSALWRPNNVSKKVKGLYFVGANTNPGIGMPICVISAETVYKRILGITDPEPLKEI